MEKLSGKQIRERWISFFKSKGHVYIPGVGLIPKGDKSLLWVNAGVTGLKKYFDGSEIPPSRRIVNVQKSIRTNDIDNVGHTSRHHTFFEMLGNFSIGDYFRNEVIPWAYELLTDPKVGFGISKDKLYITYNPMDLDTKKLWVKEGMEESHLVPLEGNFWEIGEGPCGPDTEIFFDRGEEFDPDSLGVKLLQEEIENDRYIEIWNIVFSQFNSVPGKKRSEYKELPSKNIDTGSGLERIACILQGAETNFETDLFSPIIEEAKKLSSFPYEGEAKMSYRVIADHVRCLSFALSDGAYFSNEGRGYVLRRLIRRAMRYGKKIGIEKPFIHSLVHVVVNEYGDFYPNLKEKEDLIVKSILSEEEKFIKTLGQGQALLEEAIKGKDTLDGATAFKLYDTFGFPFDLTKEICLEKGVKVDEEGFLANMKEQKERARASRNNEQSFHSQSKDLLSFKEKSEFSYAETSLKAKVIGLFVNGEKVDSIDEEGDVALDITPFYAEMGGQVSDSGTISSASFSSLVTNVSKAPVGQHLHHIRVSYGKIKMGDEVEAKIDLERRKRIEKNHSATHILHAALGKVLGERVEQKGSFVNEDYLRFDFPASEKISSSKLKEIEQEVNRIIALDIKEVTEVLPIEEAKKKGAEMEFEEKYGDVVRVVEFGDYSLEFCGGTHVSRTSEIGLFVITNETSVSAGTRRIEAKTSTGAYEYLSRKKELLSTLEEELSSTDALALSKIKSLKEEKKGLEGEIERLNSKLSSNEAGDLEKQIEDVNGISFLFAKATSFDREGLLKIGDRLKSKGGDYLFFLLGKEGALVCFGGGKGASFGAGRAIKEISPLLQGKGGGRNEMAMGSYSSLDKIEEAKAKLISLLKGE